MELNSSVGEYCVGVHSPYAELRLGVNITLIRPWSYRKSRVQVMMQAGRWPQGVVRSLALHI